MSEVVSNAPVQKPRCGEMHQLGIDKVQAHLRDSVGGLIDLQIVGTDPDVDQPINGAALTEDYVPGDTPSTVNLDPNGNGYPRVNPDRTFFLIPETDAATYAVVLADGTQYLFTGVQSTAFLGQPFPFRIWKVLATAATTGYFSVGY